MSQRISLTVDGVRREVDADPGTPLLYVLRDDLGHSNPHFGCGLAQCGACTVHVNGEPMRSCVLPVAAAAEQSITTLTGLSAGAGLHPIQQAYIDEQVPQCGYCINGWLMTAAAFLDRTPNPTDAQIRDALSGLKCRCGTHLAILRAVKRAARQMTAAAR